VTLSDLWVTPSDLKMLPSDSSWNFLSKYSSHDLPRKNTIFDLSWPLVTPSDLWVTPSDLKMLPADSSWHFLSKYRSHDLPRKNPIFDLSWPLVTSGWPWVTWKCSHWIPDEISFPNIGHMTYLEKIWFWPLVTPSDPQMAMFELFIRDSESTDKMESITKTNYPITDWDQKIGSAEPP